MVADNQTDVAAQRIAEDSTAAMMAGDAASRTAGMTVLGSGPGWGAVAMAVTESMVNGHAIAHGGYVFMVADTAFAVACNSYGPVTVAAGCDIDFVAPARLGDRLVAEAKERYRRGRSGLYDITVRRADGEVVAEMRGRSRTVGTHLTRAAGAPAEALPASDRQVSDRA